jgi:hypothetical protein
MGHTGQRTGHFGIEQAIQKAKGKGKQKNAEELSQGIAEISEHRGVSACAVAHNGHHSHIEKADQGKGQAGGKGHITSLF